MQQIADWLEKLGMSEYAQRFRAVGSSFMPSSICNVSLLELNHSATKKGRCSRPFLSEFVAGFSQLSPSSLNCASWREPWS
jgi:hypothetical protein